MSSVSAGLSRSSPAAAPIPPQPPIIIAQGTYPSPRPWLAIPRYKEYSLIFPINRGRNQVSPACPLCVACVGLIVPLPRLQVLLGLKKRGFAQGMYVESRSPPPLGPPQSLRDLTKGFDITQMEWIWWQARTRRIHASMRFEGVDS